MIMMSGDASPKPPTEAARSQTAGYLRKPFTKEELIEEIMTALVKRDIAKLISWATREREK